MDCRHARLLLDFARPQGAELEPGDTHELESHLSDCPECGALAGQERRVDEHLGRAMRSVPVPDNLRNRLLSRLAVERDSYYRRWLVRVIGVTAAAAAVVLLIWGGWLWHKNQRQELVLARVVDDNVRPTFSPEAVEGWFQEAHKVRTHAPSSTTFNYHRLTDFELVEFGDTGKRVPMLLFTYGGKDVAIADQALAKVFIVTDQDFKGLEELVNQPPKGSKGYRVRVLHNPQHRHVYYVVMYTEGSLRRFFSAEGPGA
jgi:hypothetical protein